MNNSNKNNSTIKNVMSWVAVILVTLIAFFCTYYYSLSAPVRVIIWLGWLIATLFFFYLTSKGKQLFAFAREAKIELLKVVWPTRKETTQTTMIVMVMVTVTSFVLWGVDSIMMWAIAKITHLG